MSYELLQSHLQSTMHTLNHSKIGKKNQGAHKKTDKKNGAAKPTVHKTTKSTINKKKISNIGNFTAYIMLFILARSNHHSCRES